MKPINKFMNKESEKLAKQLGVSKSDCLKLEWQEFVEKQIWQGEDEHTKNMGVGNAADWWLEKIHQALAEERERVRETINALEIAKPNNITDEILYAIKKACLKETKQAFLSYLDKPDK